jgi:hypothetical protein
MLPKKKEKEKKVLLPTGVSKSTAHTVEWQAFKKCDFILGTSGWI